MGRTVLASVLASCVVSALVTLLAVSVAIPAVAGAQGTSVRSQDFVLVGSDGSRLARLWERTNPVTGSTGAFLGLFQGEALRANFSYGQRVPEAAALTLRDTNGDARIGLQLAVGVEGGSGDLSRIAIWDGERRVRVHIGVDGAGSPFIELRDADGNVTWSAR